MKKLAAPLLVLVLVIAGWAGMDQTSGVNTAGPTANASGAWSGWAGMGAVAAPVSLTLSQSGGNVKGDIDVAGRPDLTGPVVGTVQGNALTLRLQTGYGQLPVMKVGQNEISGVISLGPLMLTRAK